MTIDFTPENLSILKEFQRGAKDIAVYQKLLMLVMLHKGLTQEETAFFLCVDRTTVNTTFIFSSRAKTLTGTLVQNIRPRSSKLPEAQEAELRTYVSGHFCATSQSNAIEKIEHHSYFNGQVGFILNFAKTNNRYDINKFSDYSEKMNKLFSYEFQDNDDCLFQRALLTFGNYLVSIAGHYTFCNFEKSLRAKTDNWRKVFNDEAKSNYLKKTFRYNYNY